MNNKTELKTIFSGLNGSKRILHLYTSTIDKYAIHKTFLSEGNGESVYVTNEDPDKVRKELCKPKLSVTKPTDIKKIQDYKTVVIDGTSVAEEQEFTECVNNSKLGQTILCTFDVSKLSPEKIKELVEKHDKLILTTDGTTIVSAKSFSRKDLSKNDLVDEFVKKELKTLVLALLLGKPMCGTDIKKKIFEKFNILLSSGTLYPLLHELEEKKLLTCRYGVKTKTYEPVNKKNVESMLNEHLEIKNFLNSFLQKAINGEGEERERELKRG